MSYARNLARIARTGAPSVDSLQALRNMPIYDGFYPETVIVKGHTTPNDGGGGIFIFVDAVGSVPFVDDNGLTIVPVGGNNLIAYVRQFEQYVTPEMYGGRDSAAISAASLSGYPVAFNTVDEYTIDTKLVFTQRFVWKGFGSYEQANGADIQEPVSKIRITAAGVAVDRVGITGTRNTSGDVLIEGLYFINDGACDIIIRCSDTFRPRIKSCSFNNVANIAAESIRFECNESFCESPSVEDCYMNYGIPIRTVPASEANVVPARYRPVTASGTDSFLQMHLSNVLASTNGGFRLWGELGRVVVDHCGGWHRAQDQAMFHLSGDYHPTIKPTNHVHFITPFIDPAEETKNCGLFKLESPLLVAQIENAVTGGMLPVQNFNNYWFPRWMACYFSYNQHARKANQSIQTNKNTFVRPLIRQYDVLNDDQVIKFKEEFLYDNQELWGNSLTDRGVATIQTFRGGALNFDAKNATGSYCLNNGFPVGRPLGWTWGICPNQ